MKKPIRERWKDLNDQTIGTNAYWRIALQNASFYGDMKPLVRQYVRGRTLDLGAGRLAWSEEIRRCASSYVSADVVLEHPELELLFDVTHSFPFRDGSFDTVFCCSVLEHTLRPWKAFPEIFRILAGGGVAVVAAPFLYYLHGEPHDYYRFTRYACGELARESGFEIERMVANGGFFTFALNVFSIGLSTLLFSLGLRGWVGAATLVMYRTATALDRCLDLSEAFAMNHIMVLRKPSSPSAVAGASFYGA